MNIQVLLRITLYVFNLLISVEALFFLSTQDHVFSMRATMAECAFQGAMDFIASACLVSLEQDAKVIYDEIKNIR